MQENPDYQQPDLMLKDIKLEDLRCCLCVAQG